MNTRILYTKILCIPIVLLAVLLPVAAHTLDQYPRFFLDEEDRPEIVLGDKAPAVEVVIASRLAVSLQNQAKVYRLKLRQARLASELRSTDHDMILVGSACKNKAIQKLLRSKDCNPYRLEEGEALIALEHNNGKHQLIVTARDANSLADAVQLLISQQDLSGSEIKLVHGRIVKPVQSNYRKAQSTIRTSSDKIHEERNPVKSRSATEQQSGLHTSIEQRIRELDAFLATLRTALDRSSPSQTPSEPTPEPAEEAAVEEEVVVIRIPAAQ